MSTRLPEEDIVMRRLATSTVVMALALLTGVHSAPAQSSDEAAIAQAVEAFRKAMLGADRSQFEALCADQLSYGHSAGRLETKAQFIDGSTSGRTTWKFITLTDQTNQIVGPNAIARHILTGETVSEGKTNAIKIGILMVWQKQDGRWKLLARQAYRI
jgi:ketosteroid isomerase-like protein